MEPTILQAPVEEPITLEEARFQCSVESDQADAFLSDLISRARELAENITGRALIDRKLRLYLEAFPSGIIELPRPPLVSVEKITYLDLDGIRQEIPSGSFDVYTSALIGSIEPAYGMNWPAHRQRRESINIDFTAGYGSASDVPGPIKTWMLLCIGTWYAYREQIITGAIVAELPRGVWDSNLDYYRIWRY